MSKHKKDKKIESTKIIETIVPEFNNFSIAEEVYKDNPEKLEHYKKQRETRGFDDTETWHLDKTFAQFMIPRLKRFVEVNICLPYGETDVSYNKKLRTIITSLEEYYSDDNIELTQEEEKRLHENAKNAIQVLSELWFSLWW